MHRTAVQIDEDCITIKRKMLIIQENGEKPNICFEIKSPPVIGRALLLLAEPQGFEPWCP